MTSAQPTADTVPTTAVSRRPLLLVRGSLASRVPDTLLLIEPSSAMSFSPNPCLRVRIHVLYPAPSTNVHMVVTISPATTPTVVLALLLLSSTAYTDTYKLLALASRSEPRAKR